MYGTVESTRWLTPSMVRVEFGGAGLDEFAHVPFTDAYLNALFLPPESTTSVPFDVDELRSGPSELRPRGRRYTVRSWDERDRRLTIDFVAHGDAGLAGRWAQAAQPGDRLQMVGPTGAYAPDVGADWHLYVGDESALPAIAASLERVPVGRAVLAVLLVDDGDHELELECPGDLSATWVHRCTDPADPDLLPRAVSEARFPHGRPDVFVHGEAAETRAIRRHLIADRGVACDGVSISPYWRRGHDDEAWRKVKARWLADSEEDV
jgi:NADPH-dependent ferric siderophore reductase